MSIPSFRACKMGLAHMSFPSSTVPSRRRSVAKAEGGQDYEAANTKETA